jgi:secreted trypsin-like serine protease
MLKIAFLLLATPSFALAMVGGELTARDSIFAKRSVLLISGDANRCTGTLIGRRLVLTAAHCLQGEARRYTAVFTNDLTPFLQGKERVPVRAVQELFIDPRFTREDFRDDVALALLAEPAPEDTAIAPLAETRQAIPEGAGVLSLGFGLQNREGMLLPMAPDARRLPWEPVQLRQKSFHVSAVPESVQKHFAQDANYHRLHVSQPGGGICVGDSGGPVYWMREGADPLLIGVNGAVVTEAGARCGSNALITRVDTARAWIAAILEKYGD